MQNYNRKIRTVKSGLAVKKCFYRCSDDLSGIIAQEKNPGVDLGCLIAIGREAGIVRADRRHFLPGERFVFVEIGREMIIAYLLGEYVFKA